MKGHFGGWGGGEAEEHIILSGLYSPNFLVRILKVWTISYNRSVPKVSNALLVRSTNVRNPKIHRTIDPHSNALSVTMTLAPTPAFVELSRKARIADAPVNGPMRR